MDHIPFFLRCLIHWAICAFCFWIFVEDTDAMFICLFLAYGSWIMIFKPELDRGYW
jgi:hypothetical protein